MLCTADISKIVVKWHEIASKLKINITTRLSVTDYPYADPWLGLFGGFHGSRENAFNLVYCVIKISRSRSRVIVIVIETEIEYSRL
jgi:hypothetical protein